MRAIPILIAAILVLAIGIAGMVFLPGIQWPMGGGGGVDSSARIEIERLRLQIETLQEQSEKLENRMQRLEESRAAPPPNTGPIANPAFRQEGPNNILDQYTQVVQIADRRNVNNGITVASPTFLEGFLGRPRDVLSDKCEAMTNPKLAGLVRLETVGPIRVRMLEPAINSLRRVFGNIEQTDPDLYARINTAGSLCVRQIRGTQGRTSTHSFGLAVDLNIDGHLDTLGDGRTQLGLTIIADFFNEEGWVWGASFGREDSMHFEVSRQQLEAWRADGKI